MGVGGTGGWDPDFSKYARRRGHDLKDGEYIGAGDDRRMYGNCESVSIRREGNYIELTFSCQYRCVGSLYGVKLPDFLAVFTRGLQKVSSLRVEETFRYSSVPMAGLEVCARYSTSMLLESAYRKLSASLKSAHAAALDNLRKQSISRSTQERRRVRPEAFICHDSRDKQRIARPLVERLSRMTCAVWHDEESLRVGDSLRESIERGLKQSRRCILVLTPRFLNNRGWTKTEFNSVFSRELLQRKEIILPVWAGVTSEELFDYCPSLLDRVGVHWKRGVDEVARELYRKIRGCDPEA
jgi:hypothetical protein